MLFMPNESQPDIAAIAWLSWIKTRDERAGLVGKNYRAKNKKFTRIGKRLLQSELGRTKVCKCSSLLQNKYCTDASWHVVSNQLHPSSVS